MRLNKFRRNFEREWHFMLLPRRLTPKYCNGRAVRMHRKLSEHCCLLWWQEHSTVLWGLASTLHVRINVQHKLTLMRWYIKQSSVGNNCKNTGSVFSCFAPHFLLRMMYLYNFSSVTSPISLLKIRQNCWQSLSPWRHALILFLRQWYPTI